MKRDIEKIEKTEFDVLVIGGGINGAAIAHIAALNGLSVCLLEKDDFAAGTSSKSTKIVHGGLRYLENFEFGLVRESLRERTIQLKNAPHLVKPLGFILPVYKDDYRPLWFMKLGVFIYDLLSGKYLIKKRRVLEPAEIEHLVPGIESKDLVGGIMYYDAQMDDARLCLENVLSARQKGASVLNYAEVRSLTKQMGKTIGVEAYDKIDQRVFNVKAKRIVAAVGPWTDILFEKEHARAPQKVRPTKGVHIVYRGEVSDHALIIPTKKEKRIFFIIPWHGNSLIGTTDTDFHGDPEDVKCEEEDIDYLFEEASRVFPDTDFKREDIVSTFAGLRPLAYREGAPSKISRRHMIDESYSGMIYVYGGKYTTYRKIAEDVVRRLTTKELVDTKEEFPLYGSGRIERSSAEIAQQYDLEEPTAQYLMDVYGARIYDLLNLIEQDPTLAQPLAEGSRAIKAQAVYAIQTEMAHNEEDIVERRLGLIYDDCDIDQCREAVRKFL